MAWAKFPTRWVHDKVLTRFVWGEHKSDATAALLLLIALAIQRNRRGMKNDHTFTPDNEMAIATYNDLLDLIPMSRAKVAGGLALLIGLGVVMRDEQVVSMYRLPGIAEKGGWAQLPQSHLMERDHIASFDGMTLRTQTELDALKVYMLMIAMRNAQSGYAHIGYPKIIDYTGVQGNRIKRAKSHLISLDLIYVESDPDAKREDGRPPLRYKVRGL